jgi:hypothetical protein
MTEHDTQLLEERDQQLVRLHLIDGEVVTARVLFVSETEQDVIVDLISSTDIGRYPKDDVQPKFQYEFKDIASVEPIPDGGNHQKEM